MGVGKINVALQTLPRSCYLCVAATPDSYSSSIKLIIGATLSSAYTG